MRDDVLNLGDLLACNFMSTQVILHELAYVGLGLFELLVGDVGLRTEMLDVIGGRLFDLINLSLR